MDDSALVRYDSLTKLQRFRKSGDSERRSWLFVLGLSVTLVCLFCVDRKSRRFLQKHLVGGRTRYELDESVCATSFGILYPDGIIEEAVICNGKSPVYRTLESETSKGIVVNSARLEIIANQFCYKNDVF